MSVTIYLLVFTVASVYFAIKWWLKYWERKGLFYEEAKHPLDGVLKFGKDRHMIKFLNDNYKKWKNKYKIYGGFLMMRPIVIVQDVDLAKRVMTTDSHYFQGRGMYVNTRDDPLSAHLFNLEGDHWKKLREKLTSVFTSGKMKYMFPIVTKIADEMITTVDKELKISTEVEVKELFARFTTDVIGNVAFGLECNSLSDPNAKFREMGRRTLNIDIARSIFTMVAPGIARQLHMKAFNTKITNFYVDIVRDTVQYREQNNIERNDFMDLLIKMRNKNKSNDEADINLSGLSLNEIVSQAFIFFVAGFETSSSTMTFTMFELAQNQEVQELARRNVNEVLARHKGEFTYEAINEMKYIHQCIDGKFYNRLLSIIKEFIFCKLLTFRNASKISISFICIEINN